MADKPIYLTAQTENDILQRIKGRIPDDYDKTEGNFAHDFVAPPAVEFSLVSLAIIDALRRGFASDVASTIPGEVTEELTKRAAEHGCPRNDPKAATGLVTFTGEPGAVILAGTKVSTGSTETTAANIFQTSADAVVTDTGSVDVAITATEAGANGNVGAGTIIYLEAAIPGITGVTNANPTTGGADIEDDVTLLPRYLAKVQSPSAGGNKADYVNWALEVAGVGGVSVVPVRDGPGTVSVAIIDTSKQAANQALVDAVQDYIAPPYKQTYNAETMTLGGGGVTIDNTQPDSPSCVKMVYVAGNAGTVVHPNVQNLLPKPGIWTVRPKLKVDSIAGANNLFQIGIWNNSTGTWAHTTQAGSTDAVVTWKACDLSVAFANKLGLEVYWNGSDLLELRITRLTTDNATTVWLDQVTYWSAFSKDTGEGKAPSGARVTVEPASTVLINILATLIIAPGYNAASVQAAVQANIDAYLKSLAFILDNDVRYVRIGEKIMDTAGVQDYSGLTVNGGVVNIVIDEQEVAVLGTVTLT